MKKFSFTVDGGTIAALGDSLEHAARRLSVHFGTLARFASEGREKEFDSGHPNHLQHDAATPAPEREKQTITSADVGQMPKL